MKRTVSLLTATLFVGALAAPAFAQAPAAESSPARRMAAPAAPAAESSATEQKEEAGEKAHADEVADFHRLIKMHHRMLKRLKQNPSLVSDDSFVGKYPDLRDYFSKYDGAKERFLADPGTYLKMSRAKATHREQTRGTGNE